MTDYSTTITVWMNLFSLFASMFYLAFKYEPATFKHNWWFMLAISFQITINFAGILLACLVFRVLYCRFWRQKTPGKYVVNTYNPDNGKD